MQFRVGSIDEHDSPVLKEQGKQLAKGVSQALARAIAGAQQLNHLLVQVLGGAFDYPCDI